MRRVESITGMVEDPQAFVVPTRQLEERCRDLDIHDLQPFFRSPAFIDSGFELAQEKTIIRLPR